MRKLLASACLLAIVAVPAAADEAAPVTAPPAAVDLLLRSDVTVKGIDEGASFGLAVAPAGDVNGDGIPDLIVGAPTESQNGRVGSGSAYVAYGCDQPCTTDLSNIDGRLPNPDGTPLPTLIDARGFRIDGAAPGDALGSAVAAAGDVNGDGFADVIVGAPKASPGGRLGAGTAYVVFGGPQGPNLDAAALGTRGYRIEGAHALDRLGAAVAVAGDVNGDGRDDLLVGAPHPQSLDIPNLPPQPGSAFVVYGRSVPADTLTAVRVDTAALLPTDGVELRGAIPGSLTGAAVGSAADSAGGRQLLVGAPGATVAGRTGAGEVYVLPRAAISPPAGPIALDTTAGIGRVFGAAAGDQLGSAIAGVSGADGAGLLIGAPGADPLGRGGAGAAYRLPLPAGSVDLAQGTDGLSVYQGAAPLDRAGAAVADVGDLDGDGTEEIAIGAPGAWQAGRPGAGAVHVVLGSAGAGTVDLAGLAGPGGFTITGRAGDRIGMGIAGTPDIAGEGRGQVWLGQPGADVGTLAQTGSLVGIDGWGAPAFGYDESIAGYVGLNDPSRPAVVAAHTGPVAFSFAEPVPAWITIDPQSGSILALPKRVGPPVAVVVRMTDLAGSVELPVTIRLVDVTAPMVRASVIGVSPRLVARRRGVPVVIRAGEAARVHLVLRGTGLRGTLTLRIPAGRSVVLVRLAPASLRSLRRMLGADSGRSLSLRISGAATDAAGNRSRIATAAAILLPSA